MAEVTTIQLNKTAVKALRKLKKYPRQTYNELILYLISCIESRSARQYDDFLHRAQQAKMRELWENKEDEAWERA